MVIIQVRKDNLKLIISKISEDQNLIFDENVTYGLIWLTHLPVNQHEICWGLHRIPCCDMIRELGLSASPTTPINQKYCKRYHLEN